MATGKNVFSSWGAILIVLGLIFYVVGQTPILLIVGILRFILYDIET